ncbi:MAG: helix-turn-helix domain-containing protein [Verrucomicrobia bacterium]|nr:helix-turn-helix domain-containing protein [Verrucomicrobiota bacterium]
MSEGLQGVGEIFRARRKDLNLSLKEVENSTSIRSTYLEAIEEGRIDEFISGVYALGFMKQYAQFLGVDIEDMMRLNPNIFRMPAEKHEFSYGIGTLEVRGGLGGGSKWLPNLLWTGAAAAVLVIAWYFAKFLGIL